MAQERIAGISSEAVAAKTGKTWPQWLRVLDRAGAKTMPHKEIAAYLHEEQGLPGWWAQMVTVGYEQARGLREKHQTPRGYQASGSRTVPAPISALYDLWSDAESRKKWLTGAGRFGRLPLAIRKATKYKSMRITWVDGKSSVEANFYAKGSAKSQVAVQHSKLADAKAVATMKAFWSAALDRMKELL